MPLGQPLLATRHFHYEGHEEHEGERGRGKKAFRNYDFPLYARQDALQMTIHLVKDT